MATYVLVHGACQRHGTTLVESRKEKQNGFFALFR
jgi:hypothetical protein